MLFNQFHDILAGTAIEPAYEEARDQLGEASAIATRAHNVGIQSLSSRIGIAAEPGTTPIVVFNPHAWPVRTTVETEFGGLKATDGLVDDEGQPVPFQATQSYATVSAWRSRLAIDVDLPPLGYRTYRVVPDRLRVTEGGVRTTPTQPRERAPAPGGRSGDGPDHAPPAAARGPRRPGHRPRGPEPAARGRRR